MTLIELFFKSGQYTDPEIIRLIVAQNRIASFCGAAAFLICLTAKIRQKTPMTSALLGPLMQAALAGGGIIKSLFLFFCGFRPEIFPKITELPVAMGVAASCIVFLNIVSIKTAFAVAQTEV
jgi:hypothetical protein